MLRSVLAGLVLAVSSSAWAAAPNPSTAAQLSPTGSTVSSKREQISGDLYHYQYDIRVGTTANAIVRVHRIVREAAPWQPRPTAHAVMLLHGDFANFLTNFVPELGNPTLSSGMASYLVSHSVDVWGVDRRWTLPAYGDDISDFDGMGLDQELGDIATAITFARQTRASTDGNPGPIVLGGFSHGAELTYAYAASGGSGISAIAPMDVYYDIDPNDSDARTFACSNAATEVAQLNQGNYDTTNDIFIGLGLADQLAPNSQSQQFPNLTNQQVMDRAVGLTWQAVPYTPYYHLISPTFSATGKVTGLRKSSDASVNTWLASAPYYQSEREAADLDAIWCGQTPRPELSNIHVPLFYLGSAGGFGDHGLYSTTRVSSTDVTTHVVHLFTADRVAEDYGHGDLLYAVDAPTQAWQPLTDWLLKH